MGLLSWWRRTRQARIASLVQEVFALKARVTELEEVQLRREVEWRETKDQVLRHLKRINAVKQHEDAREAASQSGDHERPPVAAVLAAKYRR